MKGREFLEGLPLLEKSMKKFAQKPQKICKWEQIGQN